VEAQDAQRKRPYRCISIKKLMIGLWVYEIIRNSFPYKLIHPSTYFRRRWFVFH